MAYRRPGVEIIQEYKPRGGAALQPPDLPGIILGTCRPVIEGKSAYVGIYDSADPDIIADGLVVLYPGKQENWTVLKDKVRVYFAMRGVPVAPYSQLNYLMYEINQPALEPDFRDSYTDITNECYIQDETVIIPSTTTILANNPALLLAGGDIYDIYIEYTSVVKEELAVDTYIYGNDINDIFQLAYPIVSTSTNPFVLYTRTDLAQTTGWTQAGPGLPVVLVTPLGATQKIVVAGYFVSNIGEEVLEFSGIGTSFVTIPDFVVMSVTKLVPKVTPANFYKVDKLSGTITFATIPTTSEDYVARYTIQNPIFGKVHLISTDMEIVDTFGNIHPSNPVAFAAWLNLKTSRYSKPVYVGVVTTNADNELEPSIVDLAKTLDIIAPFDIYTLVPLVSANKQDSSGPLAGTMTAGNLIQAHVDLYSSPNEGLERIAVLGYKSYTQINDVFEDPTRKQDQMRLLLKIPNTYADKRIRIMFPPVLETNLYGATKMCKIPGWYAGASYAGMVANSAPLNPAAPFTNVIYTVFSRIYFPGGNDYYFTKHEIDSLSANGWWFLEYDPLTNKLYNRHQLTTAVGMTETSEDSIVRAVDFTAKLFRSRLKPMIGKYNITPQYLEQITMIATSVAEHLKAGVQGGSPIAGNRTAIETILVDPNDPTHIMMSVNYDPLYPANRITVTLRI